MDSLTGINIIGNGNENAVKSSKTHEDIPDLMNRYFEKAKNNVTLVRPVGVGQSTTLPHFYPFTLDGKKVTWRFNNNEVMHDNKMLTCDHNLVLPSADEEDAGTYKAFLGDKLLNIVEVQLLKNSEDMERLWKAKFTEWCEVFDRVKRYTASCDKDSCGNS